MIASRCRRCAYLASVWLSIVAGQTMVSMSPDLILAADALWPLCFGPSSLAFSLSLLNSWGSVT